MPRPRNPVPTYRRHKQSGQAVVTIPLPGGGRKDVLLGRYDTPDSRREYERVLAEMRAGPAAAGGDVTVNEVLLAFMRWAAGYYRGPDGRPTSQVTEYRLAAKAVKALYGHTRAADFGPLALKAVRDRVAASGLCRPEVNRRTNRVRRVFKWAVAEELVPPAVYQALAAVEPLKRGRCDLPEPEPVRPVDDAAVAATLPFLPPAVRAMAEVQRLAGMRPQDVCSLRPCDIDRAGPVWVFRPPHHKSAYRGRERAVTIGPRAQAVLARFEPADPAAHYFRPADTLAALAETRTAARKTPRWPSHVRRNECKRKGRAVSVRYTTRAYYRCVVRAVGRANRLRQQHAGPGGFDPVPHWHPNQLRHAHATEVRKRFGLEAAQVVLGHAKADVTQVYAERDLTLAARVAAEIG